MSKASKNYSLYLCLAWAETAESAAKNARSYKGENRFLTYYVTAHITEAADRLGGKKFILTRKIKIADQGLI